MSAKLLTEKCLEFAKMQHCWKSHVTFLRRDKKLNNGVSYIAVNQTGLYLVTSKFTVIGVLNFH